MFDRIRNWFASKDGAPVAPEGYSRLAFPGGMVALPANWLMTDQSEAGRWIARSPDRQIEITVSVLRIPGGTLEEVCEGFADLAGRRVQAEAVRGAGAVVARPDILVQDRETLVAQYEGREGNLRQFACKMAMRRGIVDIAYVAALQEDRPWLNDVSSVVFDSLSFSGS